MAISVPPIAQVTQKWVQRAGQASGDYKNGVQAAGSAWQSGVDGAEDNWAAGVNAANASNAYSRGVQGKAAVYVDKAVNMGSSRYASGVTAASGAYNSGMGKVLGVIANITLPPRMPVGSNQARSTAVSDQLHQAKLSGQI